MTNHRDQDSEPQIVFAHDPVSHEFRESLWGWFLPGHPLTISYDPTRIVPPDDPYDFGDPSRPIVAHVQFKDGGPISDLPLKSWIGAPTNMPTASAVRAPKLKSQIEIPKDADWVTIWVSYKRPDGTVLYDSSFGRNFRFRFYHHEVAVLQADVLHEKGSPLGRLVVRIAADPTVERIVLRYRVLMDPLPPAATQIDLKRSDGLDKDGRVIWETPHAAVPAERVVAFDFVYFADARPFKDNNQGKFFLAVDPAKRLPT
jgi:hypothetical protein